MAVGITLVMLGIECFMFDQVEVTRLRGNQNQSTINANSLFRPASYQTVSMGAQTVNVTVREWMPWSLMAVGAIVLIYTFTIPRRRSED